MATACFANRGSGDPPLQKVSEKEKFSKGGSAHRGSGDPPLQKVSEKEKLSKGGSAHRSRGQSRP